MRVSSSLSSLAECDESKITPQIARALEQRFGAANQIVLTE